MVELNHANTAMMRSILDRKREYKLNIITSDFFENELVIKGKSIDIKKTTFDLVMGNPPYNDSQNATGKRGGGNSLWPRFVQESLQLIKRRGYLTMVHPPGWRKPESQESKNLGLFKKMAQDNIMIYLEIHDSKDGDKTFNSGTRYDWYVLQKVTNIDHVTEVKDINGKKNYVRMKGFLWLPNSNFVKILKLSSKNPQFDDSRIIFSRSAYGTDKKHVFDKITKSNKYTLIHSTTQEGTICRYTNIIDKKHFGVSKVIFGDSGIYRPILDLDGQYGMTQHAMAIQIKNKKDGIQLIKYLTSQEFKHILDSCMWGNFQIDWRLFAYFKDGFWRNYKPIHNIRFVDKPVACIAGRTRFKRE